MNIMTPERSLSTEAAAKRYQRERAARQEAERLLEQKALELYEANKALKAEAAENAAIAEQLECSLQELKRTQSKLIQSSKLESLGTLAGGIAHEINTPIQYIGGNLNFLHEVLDDLWKVIGMHEEVAARAREFDAGMAELKALDDAREDSGWDMLVEDLNDAITQSQQGVEQVSSIVLAMKDYANPGTNNKETLDLNAILSSAQTITHNEWKYCATLELDLEENIPAVTGVPSELNQVFLNMIVNAAHTIEDKYGDTGEGRIAIKSRASSRGGICIEVSDNGCGIPETLRQKIFDPFFTTKEVGRGSGQGLAITYDIICNKHGGDIDIDSAEDEGTTFIIHLPESGSDQGEMS